MMDNNVIEVMVRMLQHLLAGLYSALYSTEEGYSPLTDYVSRELAKVLVYGSNPKVSFRYFILDWEKADVMCQMGKTLWTMIKHTDVSHLYELIKSI